MLLSGCHRAAPEAVVARAGSRSITAKDVRFRDRIVRLENPEETRSLGLFQLCRAYELAEVLGRNGRPITEAAIVEEERRIDRSSRDRGTLGRIRDIFGDDESAYRRVYVLPVLVGHYGPYEFFRNDPAVQASTRLRAERFLASVKRAPSTFRRTFDGADSLRELEVSPKKGLRWVPPNGAATAPDGHRSVWDEELGRRWAREILPKLRPGQVFDGVVDLGEQWLVARYVGFGKGAHRFDAGLFEKGDFSRWLEGELAAHPELRCVTTEDAKAR